MNSKKSIWTLLAVMSVTTPVLAKNDLWDDVIRKVFKNDKVIKLTAGRETKPALKFSPRVVSFKGVIEVPSQIYLSSGAGSVNAIAGQIIVDGRIICNYSPRSNALLANKVYFLQNCSDGSRRIVTSINGGVRRCAQTGRKSVAEYKGKSALNCETDKSSRYESRS